MFARSTAKVVILAGLVAGAVSFGLSASGSGAKASSANGREKHPVVGSFSGRAAAAVVKSWVGAVALGDDKTACRLMDDNAQADLHQGSVESCAQAVVSEARTMNGFVARGLTNVMILKIRVSGARATVRVADIAPAGDGGLGFLAQFSELRLAHNGLGWRITGLVPTSTMAQDSVPV